MSNLVAIGDSLTQGFQSFAITNTDLSYPSMIAERMGILPNNFALPNFKGSGGLPCNIEWLARRLELTYGANIRGFDWITASWRITELIDEVEDYWERGKGSQPVSDILYNNLAVWGFEVADAYNITSELCKRRFKSTKDDWFSPPSEPRARTAFRVLNPQQLEARDVDTQLSVSQKIKDQVGQIKHLILWLGSNNALGTVLRLEIDETDNKPPGSFSNYTLWKPKAFKAEYELLAEKVAALDAKNVYVGTVPHVTIPPITRGVMKDKGQLPPDRKYYDYYTRFWIQDKSFNPNRDPHLTGADAKKIDDYIDEYNEIIRDLAKQYSWNVVDLCDVLDRLAVRRNHGNPKYPLPPALSDLSIRFFEIFPSGKIKNGGLMSLDGVHPTTCGYGIVAQEFINVIREYEPTIMDMDFESIRRWDTLVSNPPQTLDDIFGMLESLERRFHLSRWLSI